MGSPWDCGTANRSTRRRPRVTDTRSVTSDPERLPLDRPPRSGLQGRRASRTVARAHQGGGTTMSDVGRTLTSSVLTVALALWAGSAGAQPGMDRGMYGADYGTTRYSSLDHVKSTHVRTMLIE